MKYLLFFCLAILTTQGLQSQTEYNLEFTTSISGGNLLVDVYIGFDVAASGLGSSNFRLNATSAGLDFANATLASDNLPDGNYGPAQQTVTYAEAQDILTLNIVLTNFFANGEFVPATTTPAASGLNIGTIQIPITNTTATFDLSWNTTIGSTVFFNTTPLTAGLLLGSASAQSLPVEFSSFAARQSESHSNLYWVTASEINASHFEVEHSQDGREFAYIGKVAATGFSQTESSYDFLHKDPGTGTHYYRLKQIDCDGSYDYSDVRSVRFEGSGAGAELAVYPNPATTYATITIQAEVYTVRVFDQSGRLVTQLNNTTQLDVSDWTAGVYLVQLLDATGQALEAKRLSVVQ